VERGTTAVATDIADFGVVVLTPLSAAAAADFVLAEELVPAAVLEFVPAVLEFAPAVLELAPAVLEFAPAELELALAAEAVSCRIEPAAGKANLGKFCGAGADSALVSSCCAQTDGQ
jgi:hypothetical protein